MGHLERIEELKKLVVAIEDKKSILDEIHNKIGELKNEFDTELKNASSVKNINFNEEGMNGFKKHWWTVIKKTEYESEVRVPKMYDVNLGWLINQDEGYNYFKVNPVTNWISEIPPEIKKDLDFADPLEIKIDGNVITGKDVDKAEKKYGNLVKRQGNKLIIKTENVFDVFAKMMNDGFMPFGFNPIKEEFHSKRPMFELPDSVEPSLVENAVKTHFERSRTIIVLPTGFGKTFIALQVANQLKPRYLFIVNKSTILQWEKRIEEFTKIEKKDYDICTYQYAINHYMKNKYSLVVADEYQHIAADTFSQVLKIQTESFMGLTGSPFREDDRQEALGLFGYPIGANWNLLKNSRFYNPPKIHVWVYKDENHKFAKFEELIQTEKKCLIYCDSIDLGESLSKKFNVPFIQGSTSIDDRQKTLNDSQIVIGSRIIDEGVSVIDADLGIEIDWKGVSRAQALQRAGRLMHNKKSRETEHHIIMTVDEYTKDKGRLAAYYEKGLSVIHHKESGIKISDIIVNTRESRSRTLTKARKLITERKSTDEFLDSNIESKYPLLKYAGVKKIYGSLGRSHKNALLFFIDPANQDKSFTIENFAMAMGYTVTPSNISMTKINILKPLLEKRAIVEINGRFQQNFTKMIAN